jgi:hypothetical protein
VIAAGIWLHLFVAIAAEQQANNPYDGVVQARIRDSFTRIVQSIADGTCPNKTICSN